MKSSFYGGVIAVVLGLIAVVVWAANFVFKRNTKPASKDVQEEVMLIENGKTLNKSEIDRIASSLRVGLGTTPYGKAVILSFDALLAFENFSTKIVDKFFGGKDLEGDGNAVLQQLFEKGTNGQSMDMGMDVYVYMHAVFGSKDRIIALVYMLMTITQNQAYLVITSDRAIPNIILALLNRLVDMYQTLTNRIPAVVVPNGFGFVKTTRLKNIDRRFLQGTLGFLAQSCAGVLYVGGYEEDFLASKPLLVLKLRHKLGDAPKMVRSIVFTLENSKEEQPTATLNG